MNKRKWTKSKYLFESRTDSFNKFGYYFGKGKKGKHFGQRHCLTIDDTSNVKISFYFRREYSSIEIEKKIERRKKGNFNSLNWLPFREHDLPLFRLKAEGILLFPPKAERIH